MQPNPFMGVVLHAIGGLAAGSFYAPLKKVRRWAWESYWMIMGLAAWLAAPWIVASITIPDLLDVLRECPLDTLGYAYLFGVLWGIGGLNFGLTMRYLGIALGMAVALGFCMIFGTLVPPIVDGQFGEIASSTSGRVILGGVFTCCLGIAICGLAGMCKEKELTDEQKKETIAEFKLGKGFLVATVSGILSACFAYGLAAGADIAKIAEQHGANPLYGNNATLVVILAGGLTTNFIWCLILNARNKTFCDYTRGPASSQGFNYIMSALGGVIWYGQFFFYGMGTTRLGERYDFSSWSIHMAFIIVFSNLWGLYFKEWKGTSGGTRAKVWLGILTLITSTIVIGYGNYLND